MNYVYVKKEVRSIIKVCTLISLFKKIFTNWKSKTLSIACMIYLNLKIQAIIVVLRIWW